jgi:glycosyltransferase involved in cell wall biosynthesis
VKPLVSILIPAFNAETCIADTMRSAVGQSWPRKEVVVVDDGSTDGTLSLARKLASPSVQVIHQENQGAAAARNKALSVCQGDYIQWLDADDLLSVDKINSQVRVLTRDWGPNQLASSGWGYFRYRPWKAKFTPSPLWEDLEPLEWMLRKWETNSHMQTATWLVSRHLTEAAGAWDTRLLTDDDGEYFSRVIGRSDGIRFVSDARVYYRISPSSRLSYIGASNTKIDSQFLGMELQIGYLRSRRDDERVRAACTTYLETWMAHFYPNRPDLVERAQLLAKSWGVDLRLPRLSWKYDWIRRSFGWPAAKHVQLQYNEAKSRLFRAWDRLMLGIQGGAIDVSTL